MLSSLSSIMSENLTLSLGTDCLTLSVFSSAWLVSCFHLYVCLFCWLSGSPLSPNISHLRLWSPWWALCWSYISLLSSTNNPLLWDSGHSRNSFLGEQQILGGDYHGEGYLSLPGPKSTKWGCVGKSHLCSVHMVLWTNIGKWLKTCAPEQSCGVGCQHCLLPNVILG